jgi:hypothetical protein
MLGRTFDGKPDLFQTSIVHIEAYRIGKRSRATNLQGERHDHAAVSRDVHRLGMLRTEAAILPSGTAYADDPRIPSGSIADEKRDVIVAFRDQIVEDAVRFLHSHNGFRGHRPKKQTNRAGNCHSCGQSEQAGQKAAARACTRCRRWQRLRHGLSGCGPLEIVPLRRASQRNNAAAQRQTIPARAAHICHRTTGRSIPGGSGRLLGQLGHVLGADVEQGAERQGQGVPPAMAG